jgi:hypothetical protein
LTGKDLKNNSITLADLDGLGANVVVRAGTPATGPLFATGTASCKSGEEIVSGGYTTAGQSQLPSILINGPSQSSGNAKSWTVTAALQNPGTGATITVNPFALCAS